MGKNFQGRASSAYLINGKPPTPPVGGWVEPTFSSAPFKFLLEQYKNHGLSTTQAPSWLWQQYSELRCVDPKKFRRFKQSCVNFYRTGNSNGNTYGARTKSRKPAPPGEMDAGMGSSLTSEAFAGRSCVAAFFVSFAIHISCLTVAASPFPRRLTIIQHLFDGHASLRGLRGRASKLRRRSQYK